MLHYTARNISLSCLQTLLLHDNAFDGPSPLTIFPGVDRSDEEIEEEDRRKAEEASRAGAATHQTGGAAQAARDKAKAQRLKQLSAAGHGNLIGRWVSRVDLELVGVSE